MTTGLASRRWLAGPGAWGWAGATINTKSWAATSARSAVARTPGSNATLGRKGVLAWPALISATTSASRAHSTTPRPASRSVCASAVPHAPPPMMPMFWKVTDCSSPSPHLHGERVGVRGGDKLQRLGMRLPLTLALSPLKNGERGSRRLHDEGIAAAGAIVDPYALGLQVALDRLRAVLTAEARGLVAAERHGEAHGAIGVDPHGAGADALGYRGGALDRLRPDAGAEAVGDVVGDGDRFLLVFELDDGQHRPEHLLLGDAHLVVDAGEDCGLDEVLAAPLLLARRAAAQDALGALALSDVDVGEDLLVLRRRCHRADLGVELARIAEPRLLGHGDQLIH